MFFFLARGYLWGQYIAPPEIPSLEERNLTTTTVPVVEIVRGLRAQISSQDPNTVILTWQPAVLRDDYVVARSSIPINSLEVLLAARSIAVLPPGVATYLDQALEPGSYFYAVVARSQIRQKNVVLQLNENYTGIPIVITQRPEESRKDIPPPQVSLILAQKEEEGIRITWKGVATPGVSYVLYRSTIAPSSPEILRSLSPLVILGQGQQSYLDRDLPGPGNYYYAVVTRSPTGAEDLQLVPDQSYTRYGVEWGSFELPAVKDLRARYDPKQNQVQLTWQDVSEDPRNLYFYEVYRFQDPMLVSQIEKAPRLARIPQGIGSYLDKEPLPGAYYYAVVTRVAGKQDHSKLKLGENLILFDKVNLRDEERPREVLKKEEAAPKYFENFTAQSEKHAVFLSWKAKNLPPKRQIFLYRLFKEPKSLADLAQGELIARLGGELEMYEDLPPSRGIYYYAIFGQSENGGLLPDTLEARHNLVGPIYFEKLERTQKEPVVEIPTEEKEESATLEPKAEPKDVKKQPSPRSLQDIETVVRKYYQKGQYERTIEELEPFTKNADPQSAARALFYTGLCYFKLGNYRRAIDFFIHPKVQKTYGKQAKFWYEQSLEKLQ